MIARLIVDQLERVWFPSEALENSEPLWCNDSISDFQSEDRGLIPRNGIKICGLLVQRSSISHSQCEDTSSILVGVNNINSIFVCAFNMGA